MEVVLQRDVEFDLNSIATLDYRDRVGHAKVNAEIRFSKFA